MFKTLKYKLFIWLKRTFEPLHTHVYIPFDKLELHRSPTSDSANFVAYIDKCQCGEIQTWIEDGSAVQRLESLVEVFVADQRLPAVESIGYSPTREGETLIRTSNGELLHERHSDVATTGGNVRTRKKTQSKSRRAGKPARR